ncbi:MAG TPA: metal-sulfur cluster assembly factor [Dehalococcoidia bacterium]|nr:metal-sulfur cluster assembly factor [Dehalococcoidia bacterium]
MANATFTPEDVIEKLKPVQDPELRMGIVDLGLIYDVKIDDDNIVDVTFTLTTPACPLGPMLIAQIQDAVMDMEGVRDVNVDLTFSPPWDPRTMASDEVKMQLGIW